ncbi:MAG: CHASE domain-containing protein [Chloroflexi bacterium]|nr:CHASE domain-containing protein [Chloroflexota bacterium]
MMIKFSVQNAIAVFIFLAMIVATVAAAASVKSHFDHESEAAFEDTVESALDAVEEDIGENLAELAAIQSLFNVNNEVTREEFGTFVSLFLELEKGIQALEWIPRVPLAQRDLFISEVRRSGIDDFKIHPEPNGPESFPVHYVYPLEPNLPALGFDLTSEPNRFAALEKARDTGMMTATEPITLVQETEEQAGFLMFAPVYSTGDIPVTLERRRETLIGFGLAVFRVGDFIEDAIPSSSRSDFNLRVADLGEGGARTEIHAQNRSYPTLLNGDGINMVEELEVAGRKWELTFSAPSEFGVDSLDRNLWLIVLAAGATMSGLTFGFSYLLLNGRNRAISLAQSMNKSLIESESQRDRTFELSQDLIITAGRDGKFVFVSGAARSMLGREPSEMMGQTLLEFIHPRDHDKVREASDRTWSGERSTGLEVRFLRLDGSIAWVEWNLLHVEAPDDLIFGVGRDITDRKSAEEEINNLARFPSENPNPVLRIGPDGAVLYANAASQPLRGAELDNSGQTVSQAWREIAERVLSAGENQIVESNINGRVFSFVFAPISAAGYVNVYGRDVTDRAEMDRLKDEFISVASHELRTPVTSIKGLLELLTDDQSGPLTEDQSRFLEIIVRDTDRLDRLVGDLLDVSRIDSKSIGLEQSEFNLSNAIEEVILEMESEIAAKQIEVVTASVDRSMEVYGDPGRINQVISNLLGNAVKYSPKRSSIQVVASSWAQNDQFAQLSIRDEGPGISPEDIDRLFDKFYRADNSLTRSTTGTGLGLAIAKAVVELHGGEIWVESVPGSGSEFSFTIPKKRYDL